MMAPDVWDARVGDEVKVESHKLRAGRRLGVIVEVLGTDEHPYYRVRWQDGRETVFHPGSDAVFVPHGDGRRRRRERSGSAVGPREPTVSTAAVPVRHASGLRARPGDRLVIKGHRLGEPTRDAEILEVLGADGAPPFRVRWWETGKEGVLFPGADAAVEHFPRHRRSRKKLEATSD